MHTVIHSTNNATARAASHIAEGRGRTGAILTALVKHSCQQAILVLSHLIAASQTQQVCSLVIQKRPRASRAKPSKCTILNFSSTGLPTSPALWGRGVGRSLPSL